jgi:hypothetical protein
MRGLLHADPGPLRSRKSTGAKVEGQTCDLKLAPDCTGAAEVHMTTVKLSANTCLPCGKAFQRRYPTAIDSLTITPLP